LNSSTVQIRSPFGFLEGSGGKNSSCFSYFLNLRSKGHFKY
jgi:hypothetical protein